MKFNTVESFEFDGDHDTFFFKAERCVKVPISNFFNKKFMVYVGGFRLREEHDYVLETNPCCEQTIIRFLGSRRFNNIIVDVFYNDNEI